MLLMLNKSVEFICSRVDLDISDIIDFIINSIVSLITIDNLQQISSNQSQQLFSFDLSY